MPTLVRSAPLGVVSGLLIGLAPGAMAAHLGPVKRPCAVPRGWKVAAQDRQVLVLDRRATGPTGGISLLYRYCLRETGRFRFLFESTDDPGNSTRQYPDGPYDLRLGGAYIAFGASWGYRATGSHAWITLVNTQKGTSAESSEGVNGTAPATLLLSPAGVAAWLWRVGTAPNFIAEVRALLFRTEQTVLLDSSPSASAFSTGALSNLRLYECIGGCRSSSTVLAWTDGGSVRYATF